MTTIPATLDAGLTVSGIQLIWQKKLALCHCRDHLPKRSFELWAKSGKSHGSVMATDTLT